MATQKQMTQGQAATGRIIAPNGVVMPEGTVRCRVHVDGTRTPQEIIDATGRKPYVDEKVLATMPSSESGEFDVYFIPTGQYIPVNEAPAFLAQFGLVFHPRAQVAKNESDPAFADKYQNASQWDGNCVLAFGRRGTKRVVGCVRYITTHWDIGWFLSGVPAPRKGR